MSIIFFANSKGSPGGTSLALAFCQEISKSCPSGYVECDPSGGELCFSMALPSVPGLLTLANDFASPGLTADGKVSLEEHVRNSSFGPDLLLAPPAPEAFRMIEQFIPQIIELFVRDRRLWVVDLGRITPSRYFNDELIQKSIGFVCVLEDLAGSFLKARGFFRRIGALAIPLVLILDAKSASKRQYNSAKEFYDIICFESSTKEFIQIQANKALSAKANLVKAANEIISHYKLSDISVVQNYDPQSELYCSDEYGDERCEKIASGLLEGKSFKADKSSMGQLL